MSLGRAGAPGRTRGSGAARRAAAGDGWNLRAGRKRDAARSAPAPRVDPIPCARPHGCRRPSTSAARLAITPRRRRLEDDRLIGVDHGGVAACETLHLAVLAARPV